MLFLLPRRHSSNGQSSVVVRVCGKVRTSSRLCVRIRVPARCRTIFFASVPKVRGKKNAIRFESACLRTARRVRGRVRRPLRTVVRCLRKFLLSWPCNGHGGCSEESATRCNMPPPQRFPRKRGNPSPLPKKSKTENRGVAVTTRLSSLFKLVVPEVPFRLMCL